jgi:antitoxin CcdA
MNAEPPRRRKRPLPPPDREATSVSLDKALVAEAEDLGVDVSAACEAGLAAETREARKRKWQEENRDSIQGWNDWVAKNGLPLAKYRQF